MDKKAVIIGGVIVLGLGAYFYFKPKKTGADSSMSGLPPANTNSQITVPPSGTVLTSPEEIEKIAQKIGDANALAFKIESLRNEKEKVKSTPINVSNGIQDSLGLASNSSGIQFLARQISVKEFDKKIADLEKLINDLGYKEVNGRAVKIV